MHPTWPRKLKVASPTNPQVDELLRWTWPVFFPLVKNNSMNETGKGNPDWSLFGRCPLPPIRRLLACIALSWRIDRLYSFSFQWFILIPMTCERDRCSCMHALTDRPFEPTALLSTQPAVRTYVRCLFMRGFFLGFVVVSGYMDWSLEDDNSWMSSICSTSDLDRNIHYRGILSLSIFSNLCY